jgi:kinesin family protein 3/17
MPRSFMHLFSAIQSQQDKQSGVRFLIRCSFFEIYNEELRDLLSDTTALLKSEAGKRKLEIKEI